MNHLLPLEIYAVLISSFFLTWLLVKLVCNGFILIASAIYLHKFDQVDDTFDQLVKLKFGKTGAFALLTALTVLSLLCFYFLGDLRSQL